MGASEDISPAPQEHGRIVSAATAAGEQEEEDGEIDTLMLSPERCGALGARVGPWLSQQARTQSTWAVARKSVWWGGARARRRSCKMVGIVIGHSAGN